MSKQPVSATTILKVDSPPRGSSSPTIDILATWKLSQLQRVYKAAKQMQRVSSAWSDEKEVTVIAPSFNTITTTDGDKAAVSAACKVSMRIILVPYSTNQEQDEQNKRHQQGEQLGELLAPSTATVEVKVTTTERVLEPTKVPFVEFVLVGNDNDDNNNNNNGSNSNDPSEASSSSSSSFHSSRLGDGDEEAEETAGGGFDAATGTSFSTAVIPKHILSKNILLSSSSSSPSLLLSTDSLEFMVKVKLSISNENLFASENSSRQVQEKVQGQDESSVTASALMQGVFGAVGGFWDSVKKTATETADAMAHRTDAKNGPSLGVSSSSLEPHPHSKPTITTASVSDAERLRRRHSLPSLLSAANSSAEKALHRWLKWISSSSSSSSSRGGNSASSEEQEQDGATDDETNRMKQQAVREFNFFARMISATTATATSAPSPVQTFIFSCFLLSPFAAVSAMKEKENDLRDVLTRFPTSESVRDKSNNLNSYNFALQLAQCQEPKEPFASNPLLSAIVQKNVDDEATENERSEKRDRTEALLEPTPSGTTIITTITTTTSSSTTMIHNGEKVSEQQQQQQQQQQSQPSAGKNDNDNRTQKSDEFHSLLLHHNCQLLVDFISTIANVLVVQVQDGAHYRPLLRAEGWGRFIHFAVCATAAAADDTSKTRGSDAAGTCRFRFVEELLVVVNRNLGEGGGQGEEAKNISHAQENTKHLTEILRSGYCSVRRKQPTKNRVAGDDDDGNDHGENEKGERRSDDSRFKIVTDDFTIAKEERLRRYYGLFVDARALLFDDDDVDPPGDCREQPPSVKIKVKTMSMLSSHCLADSSNLVDSSPSASSSSSTTFRSIEELLDFLSGIANQFSLSTPSSVNSEKLISALRCIENQLARTGEANERDLWGERIVAISEQSCSGQQELITCSSLRRKVSELIKVAEMLF